jgi:hypothetical protein
MQPVGKWKVSNTDLGADIYEYCNGFLFGVQKTCLVCQMSFQRNDRDREIVRTKAKEIVQSHNRLFGFK